jgi:uracil-DNA glycosylase family 4
MNIRSKPESCRGCIIEAHGTDFTQIKGTGSNGVMTVAEASGEMEAREGRPLVEYAPAGSVHERVLRRMGLSQEQFSTTNVLRCRPRNNWLEGAPYEFSAINQCRPNLDQAVVERKPRCIVALGNTSLRELTGMTGEQRTISHLAGYVLPGPNNIPVIGNFHPAYLRRGKASHQGVYARIYQRALNIAKGADRQWLWNVDPKECSTWNNLQWLIHPSEHEARTFLNYVIDNPGLWLAADFETAESASLDEDARVGFADTQIIQAQFAILKDGQPWAIALPYVSPYKEVIHKLLNVNNPMFGHNWWLFDHKVAKASAEREGWVYAPKSQVHDTLQMFHHWQPDLPAHLQFAASFIQFPFPWKHLAGSHIEFYGCADVHSDLLLGMMLEKTLHRDNTWGDQDIGYQGMVYEVRPILEGMEDEGIPIDDSARLNLDEEFTQAQGELLKEIQAMVPSDCCRVHPKEGYKGIPPEVKEYTKEVTSEEDRLSRYRDIAAYSFKEPGEDGETYHYECRNFPIVSEVANDNPPARAYVNRWCRVYDFNPNSRSQVLAYMNHKGHKPPKSKEEDENGQVKETTAEKALRRLSAATGDILYVKIVEYRGFTKLRGTYIDGFKPGSDGRVHPTFGFDTAIGQLTAKNPNSQNFPKLKPTPRLAKAMRGMVRAEAGKVLTEWDFRSFHVLTLGFLAEDPTWIRLARLDMHSFFAGHILGLWDGPTILKESDAQLMDRFRWLKSNPEWKRVRDDQAKHGILGIGNGLGPKGLFERYMENFPPAKCEDCGASGRVPGARARTTKQCPRCKGTGSVPGLRTAQKIHLALQKLAPKIFSYQRSERRLAHESGDRGYRTPFGFSRRFYEVYNFSKGWQPTRDQEPPSGDQAEQAVSYRHTNIAHCHMRGVMKELHRRGLDRKYGMFNQIHDALMFMFPEGLLDEHAIELRPIFIAPSKILKNNIFPDGLWVDVEAKWGRAWNEMEELQLEYPV